MNRTSIIELIVVIGLVAGTAIWISSLIVERNLARAETATANAATAKESARAASFESSLGTCLSAAKEQNTQVLALKAERDRLKAQQEKNKAQAAKDAKPDYDRAAVLGGMKRPAGKDACTWASELVDEELRRERGK